MSTPVQHAPLVSPDEYLAGEIESEAKHEFLNGIVYAMAGATQRHNELATNILGSLHGALRGRPCRAYGSDMLVRVERGEDLRFYYPDISIVCRPAGPQAVVQTEPVVIFEILSESTARTDTGEKRMAYLTIPTLEAYVLVDSDRREVTVWRQTAGQWAPEVLNAPEVALQFVSAACEMSVGEIYEGTGL
ncbi:MAG TPA: Uma2 family endonuclease [Chthoniobacter sp.]|jgi:Uma2 family endonuclease